MIDVKLGPWINGYDEYILMKFTGKEEYQQNFLDGKLFFNTSDYFAKCEEDGRGDCNEGSTFILDPNNQGLVSANLEVIDGKCMIVVRDYSENPDAYKPSTIFDYSEAKNRNRKIICFYTAYLNLANNIISYFPDNMADEFGKFGVLIINRQEFFKRLDIALKRMSNWSEAAMGFVEYQDLEPGLNDWNPFRKEKTKFEYQNEFRVTFVNDNENTYTLDLGCSLRDIAVPIMATDVEKMYLEEEKLYYPVY